MDPRHVLPLVLAFAVYQFAPAAAQTRVFVSGHGSDSNPCSLGAPCRSFQHAHDVATAGSEIAVLDTAGYGAVTINKAISIVNPGGVEAGISVTSGHDAITVAAGSGDSVNLRGLTIDGLGIGNNGITINSAKNVSVEQSVIRHFSNNGIYYSPTVPLFANLFVTDTSILDNGNNGVYELGKANSVAKATLTRVQAVNNVTGMAVEQGGAHIGDLMMTIVDSTAAYNNTGIAATDFVWSTVKNSTISDNNTGLLATGNAATIILSKSSITATHNDPSTYQSGWNISANSRILSYGDNLINVFDHTGNFTSQQYQ